MLRTLKAQSLLEYSVVLVVIIAALLSMQVYIKRGMQGRWKEAVDQVGEQYDPKTTKGSITQHMTLSARTDVSVEEGVQNGQTGYFSMRSDSQNTVETQTGTVTTGN